MILNHRVIPLLLTDLDPLLLNQPIVQSQLPSICQDTCAGPGQPCIISFFTAEVGESSGTLVSARVFLGPLLEHSLVH